jgi:hypothetical protein
MDPNSAASMGGGSDETLDHLLKTAQFLGVSLNDLLDLSINIQVTSGGTTSAHDENSRISYPSRTISHCDDSLPAGIQENSTFGVLPEPSLQFSLPTDHGLQVDDTSISGYMSTLEEANNTEAPRNHAETIDTRWGWHSCDEDYSFILNDLPHDSLDLSQRPPPEGSDDRQWVQITPPWSGESAESNGSSESSSRDSSINEERSGLSPKQPSHSKNSRDPSESTPSETSRILQLLAPKRTDSYAFGSTSVTSKSSLETINKTLLDMVQLNANRSISGKDLVRKKKKRSPYIDKRVRSETFLTRQINACVRCRMQRNRV